MNRLIDRLMEADVRIERAYVESQFILFENGIVLPITCWFDADGNVTEDVMEVCAIEFGSDEDGWGEMAVDGIEWTSNQ